MNHYLNNTLDVNPNQKRNKIINSGFTNLDVLVKRKPTFARKACQAVRKSGTGEPQHRDVSMVTEEHLGELILHTKFRYLVQRDLDYAEATLANLDLVSDWFSQLPEDPPEDSVTIFADGANKKE